MKAKPFCLAIENGIYSLGDLNRMFLNKEKVNYPALDPKDPARPFITGKIRYETVCNGDLRSVLCYIPKRFPISGAGLFLLPDQGVSADECLEGFWRNLSEETNTALIILEARPGGWSREDIQSEVTYCEESFKRAISRVHFSLNEATYYIIGIGAGAYPAVTYGLLNSSLFSCVLADGDYHLAPKLMDQLAAIRSDHDPAASKLDVPMPVWLVDRDTSENDRVLTNYLRSAKAVDRGISVPLAKVWQQDARKIAGELDEVPIVEIRHTDKETATSVEKETLWREMVFFALERKRWLGIGNGSFRAARSWKDMGLKRFEGEYGGITREWFVYEPGAYRLDPEKKYPLLLAIHGYSCSGQLFAENTEWHAVGEKRDFFVLYVSALPSNASFDGCTVPLPTWNSIGLTAEADDVSYIRTVLDKVCMDYPIDAERIYVSGHSNGSLMTQRLMVEMPERFAAFAPQGASMFFNFRSESDFHRWTIPNDGIVRPVWLMMGSDDIGDRDEIADGNSNDLFISRMCFVNGIDRKKEQILENGKYTTHSYLSSQGIPLVRFTSIRNTPHSFTHEFAQIYWNEFLCHFRRKEDLTIEYTV